MKKTLPQAGPGKIIKAAGKVIKNKAAKAVKKLDGNPERFARNVGGLGLAYLLGTKAAQKTKTAKPTKPKQLGPHSFAKGGATKMAVKKTIVKSKKK